MNFIYKAQLSQSIYRFYVAAKFHRPKLTDIPMIFEGI